MHYIVLKCRAQEFVNHDCKLGAYLNLSKFSFQGLLVLVWQLFIEFHTKPLCKAIFYSSSAICVINVCQEWDNFAVQMTVEFLFLIHSDCRIKVDWYQKVFSFLSHLQKIFWRCMKLMDNYFAPFFEYLTKMKIASEIKLPLSCSNLLLQRSQIM